MGVGTLENGNYLVLSPDWDNGTIANVGAVTWANGMTGITGAVTLTNSLVGSTAGDRVGSSEWDTGYVYLLNNGNYLVISPYWDNDLVADAGAVTWGNGTTGITGTVSPANSLVGSNPNDFLSGIVRLLPNGNYLLKNPYWDNGTTADVGAVTWGNGMTGITGTISSANSLVVSSANDFIYGELEVLPNHNYLVVNPYWDNGIIADAGAVTWGNGMTGVTGNINSANSLVGDTVYDYVGRPYEFYMGSVGGIKSLENGNYVVISPYWDNGTAENAGAATWGSGTTGVAGVVSEANSLVSSTPGQPGYFLFYNLPSGNYLIRNPFWNNGILENAGAVTWGSGTTGVSGAIDETNSLIGNHADDYVGQVTILANGNYIVSSPNWDNGAIEDAGAVTWASGTVGITGVVDPTNSLVGSKPNDQVGEKIRRLSNGNYLIASPTWDNGAIENAGAVTWASGTVGITGVIDPTNSLVGSSIGDQVGSDGIGQLPNGNYIIRSPYWDNGSIEDAGAMTWGEHRAPIPVGPINVDNSVLGTTSIPTAYGDRMNSRFDNYNNQLIVGRPAENMMTLFYVEYLTHEFYLPVVLKP